MVTSYIPRDPDNTSIKASLKELKKMNASSKSYNELTIVIATTTLIVSIIGVIIALWK